MQTKERFKLIAAVYALFIKDGKILLYRRANTGYEDGKYGLVAGHIDGLETMRNGMAREVLEESGVKIKNDDMDLVLTMHRWCGDHERVEFFFVIKNWDGEIKNMEPNKCDDLSWFLIDELPPNIIPYIRVAIDCYKKEIKYCEFGW